MQEAKQSGVLEWGVGGAGDRTLAQKKTSINGMVDILDGEGVKETLPKGEKGVGAPKRVLINGKVKDMPEGYTLKEGETLLGPGSVTIYSRQPAVQHMVITAYENVTPVEAKNAMVMGAKDHAGLLTTYKEILRDQKALKVAAKDIQSDFVGALYQMGGDVARVWWEVGVPKLSAEERKQWAALRPLYEDLPVPVEPTEGEAPDDDASIADEIISGAR